VERRGFECRPGDDQAQLYTDVLPSFNFVLDITDEQKVRFGAARVVSPQDLYSSWGWAIRTTSPAAGSPTARWVDLRVHQRHLGQSAARSVSGVAVPAVVRELFCAGWPRQHCRTFYKQVDSFVEIQSLPTFVKDDFGGLTGNVTEPVNAGQGPHLRPWTRRPVRVR
jgi:iron complex outermembrane receptor protein